jgi:hypothetical protein
MGCFSPDQPDDRSYSGEATKTLKTQIGLAPKVFAAESNPNYGQPAYNRLSLQNMEQMLNGTPESQSTTTGPTTSKTMWRNSRTGEVTSTPPQRGAPGAYGISSMEWQPFRQTVPGATTTTTTPGQRGLLDMYENDVAPALSRITADQNSAQRTADIGDVQNLAPGAAWAMRLSDPASAALLDQMTDQSGSELAMGAQLDPSLLRTVQQSVRSRQQGMLGGTGSAGDFSEALGVSDFANSLRQQRRQNAAGVIGLRRSFYGDPYQQILSRPGMGVAPVMSAGGQAQGISAAGGPQLFNPESAYAGNIYNSNTQMAAQFADPSTMAKIGMVADSVGKIASMAGSVAAM